MAIEKWFWVSTTRILFWLVSWSFSVVLGAPSSFKDISKSWGNGIVSCGKESLQFTLPASQTEIIPFLTALDPEGHSRPLVNTACVSVSWKQEGSVVFTVPFTGCFFTKKNGNFLMSLRIERQDTLGKVLHEEVLKCPIQLPDAPSNSVCLGIQRQDRLPCGSQPVSQEECEEKGCCYIPGDSHIPCYYGNTVTAHCTPDGSFSIAVSRDVTLPSLILDSVHLVSGHGSGCVPVTKNNVFVLYNFPLSACGTTFQGADNQGIYANELVAHHDVQNWNMGSITRESTFRIYVSCRYSAGGFLPLTVQVFTLPPPPSVTQYGPLNLELRIAIDQYYREYYTSRDYPIVKVLKDPVYLEVRVLQRTDPNLVLLLHECWATPSANPLQHPQWPILIKRCPYGGDNYQTQFVSIGTDSGLQFPSHYQRFVISTFTFVDSTLQEALTGPVYFHCSAAACIPSEMESCMLHCPGVRARRTPEDQVLQSTPKSLVTAEGPIDFQMSKEQDNTEQKGSHWISPLLSKEWERALVVAVGALFVALALVGLKKYWKRPQLQQDNSQ
ncbi:zona pellucida sperm-binding protein 4-like [Sceloporus undulatus]|uniref:zona pellucida sperm-binding protein 4-like n=1 Tax=Sceloporus undulatus TaxID=8520 RepID=UPI001C4AE05F|nr:zona pellucida sperm-binding protein 4-like [Sceloporus undulatus]